MKNNFKRIAAVILAVIMCVSAVVPVLAAEETCPGEGKTHTLANTPNYELVSEKKADCENDGLNTYKCTDCGTSFVEVISKLGAHNYEVLAEIAPDCTNEGLTTSVCTVCGKEKKEEVEALGHTYTYTFKEAGKTLCDKGAEFYAVCTVCDNKLGSKDNWQAAPGHDWELVEITTAPNCMTKGEATYACANCDEKFEKVVVEKNNHIGTATPQKVVKKADCTNDAVVLYKCEACNDTFEATPAAGTVIVITDKNGSPVLEYTVTAKGCHNVNNFTVYEEAKAATCVNNGYNVGDKVCNGCNTLYYNVSGTWKTLDKLKTENATDSRLAKHDWESGTADGWAWVGEAGDCTHNGLKARYCKVCKLSEKENFVAPGHKEPAATATDKWFKVEADCVTPGYVKYICANEGCGDLITKSETAKLGHDFTKEGAKRYISDDTVITATTPVRCGAAFEVEMKCAREGCTESTWDLVKGTMDDHKYEVKVVVAPTCKTKGYSLKVCVLCATTVGTTVTYNNYDENESITKAEYDGLDENKQAEYAVVVLGEDTLYLKKFDITDTVADAHVWDAATLTNTTKAPTCTETGLQYATCLNCNTTAQITLDALGHDWDDGVQLAGTGNCTVAKVIKFTCGVCNVTKEEGVENDTNGKGHAPQKDEAKGYVKAAAATCSTNGTTEGYFCVNPDCEFSWENNNTAGVVNDDAKYYKAPETLKNFHELSEMVKTDKVDSTCFTKGNYEYYTCKLGDACTAKTGSGANAYKFQKYYNASNVLTTATKASDLVITEKNHVANPQKAITVATVCDANGYVASVCALCDTAYSMTLQDVGAVLEHNYDVNEDGVFDEKDCIIVDNCAQGKYIVATCVDCGNVITTTVRAAGHYNAEDQKISTDCHSLVSNRKCQYCGLIIEAEDHTYGAVKFEGNLEVMTCTECGYKFETIHVHEYTTFVADGEFNHKATCACGKETVTAHTWNPGKVTTEAAVGVAGVKTFTCTACAATYTESIPALTAPVVDDNKTEDPANKGCGASVAFMGVALVAALGTCAVFTAKKKED